MKPANTLWRRSTPAYVKAKSVRKAQSARVCLLPLMLRNGKQNASKNSFNKRFVIFGNGIPFIIRQILTLIPYKEFIRDEQYDVKSRMIQMPFTPAVRERRAFRLVSASRLSGTRGRSTPYSSCIFCAFGSAREAAIVSIFTRSSAISLSLCKFAFVSISPFPLRALTASTRTGTTLASVLTSSGRTFSTSCAIKPICHPASNPLSFHRSRSQSNVTPRRFRIDSRGVFSAVIFCLNHTSEALAEARQRIHFPAAKNPSATLFSNRVGWDQGYQTGLVSIQTECGVQRECLVRVSSARASACSNDSLLPACFADWKTSVPSTSSRACRFLS